MSQEPWDKQEKAKYAEHDLSIEDFKLSDFDAVRSQAVRDFRETKQSDNVALIVASFMGFLTSKGYRIVKIGDSK